ncbi:MAG: putative outer membrane protein precursor [Syntrophorhabdus sp. PtaU1.Bin153]|nr:MAG: putative outer membrane protein precursor [Syntrophorhabdus sp. PtaU1.Bin153]
MKGLLYLCVLGAVGWLLIPAAVFGNGFDIYEQSAKAVGMGGAVTAQADEPAAIFFNPAGITQLDGTQVSVGACFVMPTMSFKSDGNPAMGTSLDQRWKIKDRTWPIPNGYVTHKVNDKVSIGLGTFAHFGLGVEWPNDWEGRFTPGTTKTVIVTTSISPVIAFKPSERLSIGFGPYIQFFDIELNNQAFVALPSPPLTPNRNRGQTVDARMTAEDWDWGWQAGLLVKIVDGLTFGASYLSEVRHRLNNGDQGLTSLANGALVSSQGCSSIFTLPATLRLGLAWKRGGWALEAGAQWTEWSSYKSLRADFDDGTFLDCRKRWHDVWTWRIGAQYRVSKYLDVRAGVFYDETPIPRSTLDPLVPSGDRVGYCGGFGLNLGKMTLDFGYNYIKDRSRRWNNPSGDVNVGPATLTRVTGRFEKAYAHLYSVNVTYRF